MAVETPEMEALGSQTRKMISIMYHDVFVSHPSESGFGGSDADLYKIDEDQFDAHLMELERGQIAAAAPGQSGIGPRSVILTFDDGGQSARTVVGPKLAAHGWKGCFFITAGKVGSPNFLSAEEIRRLSDDGSVIGSHSLTHPLQMGRLRRSEIRAEWRRSKAILEDILGREVVAASVPGGYLTTAVAQEAAEAGYRFLFTSEPTLRVRTVEGCSLIGRFTVRSGTSATAVLAAASGRWWPWFVQRMAWEGRKIVKRTCGTAYLGFRSRVFGSR